MIALALVAAALALLVAYMPALGPFFARAFPGVSPPVFAIASFPSLLLAHVAIVGVSVAASSLAAFVVGVFVTRPGGREFRAIAGALAAIGQTFPPVAVLAVAVPMLGYGAQPTFVALALYGFLPVLANVIAGIEAVPPSVREAAIGMGYDPWRMLWEVELPLAAPTILAGIRTSATITIGTATIGSTVGAFTLGLPIISGLVGNKLPYVIEGAAVVALLAILVDMVFDRLDRLIKTPRRNS